jgi:hypothetical protein
MKYLEKKKWGNANSSVKNGSQRVKLLRAFILPKLMVLSPERRKRKDEPK